MKKLLSLLCALVVMVSFTACNTAQENQNETIKIKPMVVAITDVGGIGDQSFNDAIIAALENVQKDNDIDIRCLEAVPNKEYVQTITESINEEAVLTVAAGSDMTASVEKVAKEHTDKFFAVIDGKATLPNVMGIRFADNESAFLAGYAAGKTTESGKVGFIGGDKRPTVNLFQYGYEAGVKAANPKAKVEVSYVGTFYDKEKGKKVAEKMYKGGCDVIMHVAGTSGLGIIEAAKNTDNWVIGADKDQSYLASKNVLCSAVKDIKPVMEDMVKLALNGNFKGENKIYHMNDEGVALSDNAGNIKGTLKTEIEKLKENITDGNIKVPTSLKTLAAFKLPENIL